MNSTIIFLLLIGLSLGGEIGMKIGGVICIIGIIIGMGQLNKIAEEKINGR